MGLVPLTKAAKNSARKGTKSALLRRQNSKGEVCPAQQNLGPRVNIFGRVLGEEPFKRAQRCAARTRGCGGRLR